MTADNSTLLARSSTGIGDTIFQNSKILIKH